jgi:glycosyltransferase involved in cell wall biosynthesis
VQGTEPLRVLHVIDSLNGGGAERWVWDIVRLSDPARVRHHVVTVFPDGPEFVYADRLARLGAFQRTYREGDKPHLSDLEPGPAAIPMAAISMRVSELHEPPPSVTRTIASWIPRSVKDLLRPTWLRLLAMRDSVQRAWDWMKYNRSVYMCKYYAALYGAALTRVRAACDMFEPQLVHAHTFHGYILGLILRGLRGLSVVYMQPCLFAQMRDAGAAWLPPLYACTKQWVDVFLADTGYENELTSVGVPRSRIRRIPGVVDVHSVEQALAARMRHRAEVLRRRGLPSDALLALSIGRLHPSKGHRYVLEAMPTLLSRFPTLHWMVLGEGVERGDLERRAKELGIAEHVHLEGFVEDPLPYYAAADLCFRSMIFEGENLSSYQAMAAGLPVIGFDTGSPNELLNKVHHGILVPNRDSHALAAAADAVLSMADRGRSLGQLGAAHCREHLDIRYMMTLLERTYDECARRQPRSALRHTECPRSGIETLPLCSPQGLLDAQAFSPGELCRRVAV